MSSAHYESKSGIFEQQVTRVEHFTDGLFSFRVTRPASFRFRSGEFAMIGLPNAARPVFRAYSIASPSWDDELEFYSIKVPGGPLTQHLQHVSPGDTVLLKKKATGTLVLDALRPGHRLFLLSTGTGVAPFASLIRDPETYEKFESVVLTQTCRTAPELAYGHKLFATAEDDPLVGNEIRRARLKFATSLTREASELEGRITDLVDNGNLVRSLAIPPIDPKSDRAMICGSIAMLDDMRAILQRLGFVEGSNARPGSYVVERAFVE
ncbi:MAG: ferredoxin--NADP reductase [Hyphomicrobiaceae bacterium]